MGAFLDGMTMVCDKKIAEIMLEPVFLHEHRLHLDVCRGGPALEPGHDNEKNKKFRETWTGCQPVIALPRAKTRITIALSGSRPKA